MRLYGPSRWGLAGDPPQATRLADDLAKRFPEDTIVQFNDLPTIHASAALQGSAIQAIAALAPYELGSPAQVGFTLYPVYLRVKANVAAHQGRAAAAEFQKILAALASSGTSQSAHWRTGALPADTPFGRHRQSENRLPGFLRPWKNADPDIPILKEANGEYAKLQ